MHNVKFHTERATENQIIDLVFKACRANDARNQMHVDGFDICFDTQFTKTGEHLAIVYNVEGQRCGSAIVDKHDC